jgi:hypothetical protein
MTAPPSSSFFHVNALHRGPSLADADAGCVRRTVAVTWNDVRRPRPMTRASMAARKGYIATYQPWTALPGYTTGCRPATVALVRRMAAVYGPGWGPGLLDALPAGQLKEGYFLDWHPAAGRGGAQRAGGPPARL